MRVLHAAGAGFLAAEVRFARYDDLVLSSPLCSLLNNRFKLQGRLLTMSPPGNYNIPC